MVVLKKEYPTFIDECSKDISKMKSEFKQRSKLMVEGIYNIRVKVKKFQGQREIIDKGASDEELYKIQKSV